MPRPVAVPFVVASFVLALPALAQGSQPLAGTWRFASLGNYFGGPCPGSGPGFIGDEGTFQFAANGTMVMNDNLYDVCPGGGVMTGVETGAGTYSVASEGTLLLDFDPANPGTDTARLFLRGDGTVGLHASDTLQDESSFAVVVKLSSGRSNASLAGQYHVVRQTFHGGAGVAATNELGLASFDGLGGFNESGERRTVSVSGATASAPYLAAGTYAVAADGTLNTPSGIGALAPDGELFYWLTTSGSSVALTVGVRAGTGLSAPDFAGPWGLCVLEYEHLSAAQPDWEVQFLRSANVATTGGAGAFGGPVTTLHIDSQGATLTTGALAGQYTLAPDGTLAFVVSPPNVPARLSANGTFVIGRTVSSGASGMLFGLRRCGWPAAYGTATAGAGALAPTLATAGGFPFPGNGAFQLAIGNGVGSGFSLLAFSFGQAPGLPLFGGLLWVDPGLIIGTFGVLLGGAPGVPGAGSAGLPFPLPPDPSLRSVQFWLQAGVLDAAAPQGVALTPGLDLRLCR